MSKRFLFGVVAAAVGVSACASYAARTVPILAPESYQFQEAIGDAVLIVDLYDTEAKYQTVFDTAPELRARLPRYQRAGGQQFIVGDHHRHQWSHHR